MNKKFMLVATGTLSLAGLVGAFAMNSNLVSASALSRSYVKTNTTVEITKLSSLVDFGGDWEGWGYYKFSGSAQSSKGAIVSIFDADMDESEGSYVYSDPELTLDDSVSVGDDYLMKMTCLEVNNVPYLSLKIMIHEKAEINAESTYLIYSDSYTPISKGHIPLDADSKGVPYYDIYEDPNTGDYYGIYQWSVAITNTQVANSLTIHSIHIEYNC